MVSQIKLIALAISFRGILFQPSISHRFGDVKGIKIFRIKSKFKYKLRFGRFSFVAYKKTMYVFGVFAFLNNNNPIEYKYINIRKVNKN